MLPSTGVTALLVLMAGAANIVGGQTTKHVVLFHKYPIEVNFDAARKTATVTPPPISGLNKSRTFYDYKTRIIAYKDLSSSRCYLERMKAAHGGPRRHLQKLMSNDNRRDALRFLYISNVKLTKHQLWRIGGSKVADFCAGFAASLLQDIKPQYLIPAVPKVSASDNELPEDIPRIFGHHIGSVFVEKRPARRRRQVSSVPRGRRFHGQTQSQYLNFQNGGKDGKAEAESSAQSSRAIVTGTNGMGSAQSQSGSDGDCEDCIPGRGQQRYPGQGSSDHLVPDPLTRPGAPGGGQLGYGPGQPGSGVGAGGRGPGQAFVPGYTGGGGQPAPGFGLGVGGLPGSGVGGGGVGPGQISGSGFVGGGGQQTPTGLGYGSLPGRGVGGPGQTYGPGYTGSGGQQFPGSGQGVGGLPGGGTGGTGPGQGLGPGYTGGQQPGYGQGHLPGGGLGGSVPGHGGPGYSGGQQFPGQGQGDVPGGGTGGRGPGQTSGPGYTGIGGQQPGYGQGHLPGGGVGGPGQTSGPGYTGSGGQQTPGYGQGRGTVPGGGLGGGGPGGQTFIPGQQHPGFGPGQGSGVGGGGPGHISSPGYITGGGQHPGFGHGGVVPGGGTGPVGHGQLAPGNVGGGGYGQGHGTVPGGLGGSGHGGLGPGGVPGGGTGGRGPGQTSGPGYTGIGGQQPGYGQGHLPGGGVGGPGQTSGPGYGPGYGTVPGGGLGGHPGGGLGSGGPGQIGPGYTGGGGQQIPGYGQGPGQGFGGQPGSGVGGSGPGYTGGGSQQTPGYGQGHGGLPGGGSQQTPGYGHGLAPGYGGGIGGQQHPGSGQGYGSVPGGGAGGFGTTPGGGPGHTQGPGYSGGQQGPGYGHGLVPGGGTGGSVPGHVRPGFIGGSGQQFPGGLGHGTVPGSGGSGQTPGQGYAGAGGVRPGYGQGLGNVPGGGVGGYGTAPGGGLGGNVPGHVPPGYTGGQQFPGPGQGYGTMPGGQAGPGYTGGGGGQQIPGYGQGQGPGSGVGGYGTVPPGGLVGYGTVPGGGGGSGSGQVGPGYNVAGGGQQAPGQLYGNVPGGGLGGVGPGGQTFVPGTGTGGQQQPGYGQGYGGVGGVGGGGGKDGDSQAQSSVIQDDNALKAIASSQGRVGSGTAQAQVSGTYTGSGSFDAQANTGDNDRGAQTQVTGNKDGATSAASGRGGSGQTQTQINLGSDTGALTSGAQSSGWNHATNTQVNAGSQGGMADAQAKGPGSTNSQAQIGFTPYRKESADQSTGQKVPYRGGGTASAQSGTYTGQSQTQVHGSFHHGISYTGSSQAGAGSQGHTGDVVVTPFKPIAVFSPFEDPKNIKPSSSSGVAAPSGRQPVVSGAQGRGNDDENLRVEPEEVVTEIPVSATKPLASYVPMSSIRQEPALNQNTEQRQVDSGHSETRQILSKGHNAASDEDANDDDDDYDPDEEYPDETDQKSSTGKAFQQGNYGLSGSQNGGSSLQNAYNPSHGKYNSAGQGVGGVPSQRQQVVVGGTSRKDVHIVRDSEGGQRYLANGDVLESGSRLPGVADYTIPAGFRGRVTSVSGSPGGTVAKAPTPGTQSQSQTVSLKPSYQPHHMTIPVGGPGSYERPRPVYTGQAGTRSGAERSFVVRRNNGYSDGSSGFRSRVQTKSGQSEEEGPRPDSFVSVTKSVTGELDRNGQEDDQRKKFTHTYYTKSSTCGYFTFSCNVIFGSNGRTKICKPNAPTNPDGSPCWG